jgi:hypothetical protein
MSADYELRLLRRARALADLEELAGTAVAILGAARNSGLDPDALSGLIGAANALGANSLDVYTAGQHNQRYENENAYLLHVAGAEEEISERLAAASRLGDRVMAALDAALDDLDTAHRELAAARAMAVTEPCDGCHRARDEAISAALAAVDDAETRIRYCQGAAEILSLMTPRLEYALLRIRALPGALGEVYESVYNLIRRGGRMPHEGRWVTGAPATWEPEQQEAGT